MQHQLAVTRKSYLRVWHWGVNIYVRVPNALIDWMGER